ncbi:hypothetical protein PybrP1_004616 [[Pythium] brassicae (nom. inval.)]|nr:hypothetical protein PybrP1_004616 [[Pythium] brassicae (nom. inval.)]
MAPRQHPLPKDYFGDALLTDDERTKIRETMRAQLELTLEDELAFVHTARRQVDTAKWRLVKRKRELRVFRRRAHVGVFTSDAGAYEPSVLSVGRLEGSIEDVVYGAYHTTHDEIQTNMARVCARCRGTAGYFSSLRTCGVCSAAVCSQCRAKKSIFVVASHSVYKMPCCVHCITEAKHMSVRPAEPGFSILGKQYLLQEEFSGVDSSSSPDDQNTPASKRRVGTGDEDDGGEKSDLSDELSELDVDQYQFIEDDDESGISEDDMEKLLMSMMARRRKEQPDRSLLRSESDLSGDQSGGGDASASARASPSASASAAAVAAAAAAVASGMAESVAAAPSGMTPEQAAVYYKILALQSAANEAFWIARANSEIIRGAP